MGLSVNMSLHNELKQEFLLKLCNILQDALKVIFGCSNTSSKF